MVFFEAPHRLASTLATMAEVYGPDRVAAVCRELTKTYEETIRGSLGELVEWASGEVRGEIVVVVGGAPPPSALPVAELVPEVLARADAGERLKDAVADVASGAGVTKRDLYEAALSARGRRAPRSDAG
jgi:16S rRNA (cytidine1402-2'-O)-methyltransferase